MCIALSKQTDAEIDRATLQRCFNRNPDGAGFAYAEDGVIRLHKGFFTFDEFWAAWEPHAKRHGLVHFRIKTHGAICYKNCHPWAFETGPFAFAVVHNGVLSHRSTVDKSDTGHFVEDILQPLLTKYPGFLDDPIGITILEKMIGLGNKMAILRSDGVQYIINRSAGKDQDGVWYSNSTFEEYKAVTTGTWGGYDHHNHWHTEYDGEIRGYLTGGVPGGHSTPSTKSGDYKSQHHKRRKHRVGKQHRLPSEQLSMSNSEYWDKFAPKREAAADSDGPSDTDDASEAMAAAADQQDATDDVAEANQAILGELAPASPVTVEAELVPEELQYRAARDIALDRRRAYFDRTDAARAALRHLRYSEVMLLASAGRRIARRDGVELIGESDCVAIDYLRSTYRHANNLSESAMPDRQLDALMLKQGLHGSTQSGAKTY